MNWIYTQSQMWLVQRSCVSKRPYKFKVNGKQTNFVDLTWTVTDPVELLQWVIHGNLRELGLPVRLTDPRFAYSILPAEIPEDHGGEMFRRLTSEAVEQAKLERRPVPSGFSAEALYARFGETLDVLLGATAQPGALEDLRLKMKLVPGAVDLVRRLAAIDAATNGQVKTVIFTAWGSRVARLLVRLLGLGDCGLSLFSSELFPRDAKGRVRDKDEFQTFLQGALTFDTDIADVWLFDDSPAVALAAAKAGVRRIICPRNPYKPLRDYYPAWSHCRTVGSELILLPDLTGISVEA